MKHLFTAVFIVTSLCFMGWAGNVTKVSAKANSPCPVITKKSVHSLAMLLGHDSFKVRREAHKKLIAIGRGEYSRSDKRIEMRELVLDVLEAFRTHKDPEIAYRARKIIAALSPKPPPTTGHPCENW